MLGVAASAQETIDAGRGTGPINGLIYLIKTDSQAEIDGLLKWKAEGPRRIAIGETVPEPHTAVRVGWISQRRVGDTVR